MVALSFLGVGEYKKTKYSYKNQIVETNHFAYALSEFVKPEELIIIMTDKAEQTNFNELNSLCECKPLRIPDGKSEDEFWIIFDKINSVIKHNDEVIFDITHGFRSQPFIVIVLLLYLKATKNIKINNILYGAYEARDSKDITPIFELKSFLDLIEWSNAAREFTDNGNMKYFKDLLSDIHRNSYLLYPDKPSKQLLGAGKDLEILTDAFSTIRLGEIFDTTSSFNNRLNELLKDLENHVTTKPFKSILEIIVGRFMPISSAEKSVFSAKGLLAQKSIINWYVETNKYQKAITLAREYIISKYLIEINKVDSKCLLEKGCRSAGAEELGKLLSLVKSALKLPKRKGEFGEIWMKITDIRNDINHAGMRKKPVPSDKLIKNVISIVETINKKF